MSRYAANDDVDQHWAVFVHIVKREKMPENTIFYEPGDHKSHGLPYSPFKALIAPRPIGWVSTLSADGIANLGGYSFFNAISELPPMVMFAAAPDARTGISGHKDSYRNIMDTGEFALNIVGADLLEKMIKTSEAISPDADEFIHAGLTKKPSKLIAAPLIAEAPAHLECTLYDTIKLPGTETRDGVMLILGSVIGIHINKEILTDGRIDNATFRQASRLGYRDYAFVDAITTM